jgi:hypothetical protein
VHWRGELLLGQFLDNEVAAVIDARYMWLIEGVVDIYKIATDDLGIENAEHDIAGKVLIWAYIIRTEKLCDKDCRNMVLNLYSKTSGLTFEDKDFEIFILKIFRDSVWSETKSLTYSLLNILYSEFLLKDSDPIAPDMIEQYKQARSDIALRVEEINNFLDTIE